MVLAKEETNRIDEWARRARNRPTQIQSTDLEKGVKVIQWKKGQS